MKKIKELLDKIKDYLPISRKEVKKVVSNMMVVMDGFTTASVSQAQVTHGIITEMEKIKANNAKKSEEVNLKEERVSYIN